MSLALPAAIACLLVAEFSSPLVLSGFIWAMIASMETSRSSPREWPFVLPMKLGLPCTTKLRGINSRLLQGLPKVSYAPFGNLFFFFSKESQGYFYDASAAFELPRKARNIIQGVAVSAAGMSGARYRRKVERSTKLTDSEKSNAYAALDKMLHLVECGKVSNFSMVLRGEIRTAHRNSTGLSAGEKELAENGFHFIKFKKNGALIADVWSVFPEDVHSGELVSDVWNVIPEDAHRAEYHYEPFPEDLVKNPIALTCPEGGIVLDPFVGTGVTCEVAQEMGRKSVGIESSAVYMKLAREGCNGNVSFY